MRSRCRAWRRNTVLWILTKRQSPSSRAKTSSLSRVKRRAGEPLVRAPTNARGLRTRAGKNEVGMAYASEHRRHLGPASQEKRGYLATRAAATAARAALSAITRGRCPVRVRRQQPAAAMGQMAKHAPEAGQQDLGSLLLSGLQQASQLLRHSMPGLPGHHSAPLAPRLEATALRPSRVTPDCSHPVHSPADRSRTD